MRKGLAIFVAVAILISSLWNMPLGAKAGTFSNDPLVFGVEYLDMTDSEMNWNVYDLVIPANGYLTLGGTSDVSYSSAWADLWEWKIEKLDEHGLWERVYSENQGTGWTTSTAVLNSGEKYRFYIRATDENCTTRFKVDYTFTPATGVKAASNKSGTVHVTFPGSRGIKGYEVKYKVKGTKEWKTESFASTTTLNTEISGLNSGTTYIVKARAWTEDGYGHRYFSKWSKSKKVKVK